MFMKVALDSDKVPTGQDTRLRVSSMRGGGGCSGHRGTPLKTGRLRVVVQPGAALRSEGVNSECPADAPHSLKYSVVHQCVLLKRTLYVGGAGQD